MGAYSLHTCDKSGQFWMVYLDFGVYSTQSDDGGRWTSSDDPWTCLWIDAPIRKLQGGYQAFLEVLIGFHLRCINGLYPLLGIVCFGCHIRQGIHVGPVPAERPQISEVFPVPIFFCSQIALLCQSVQCHQACGTG